MATPPPLIPLDRSFFAPSADVVAPALLGCGLLRRTPEGYSGGWIVETEAYLVGDPACHAFRGQTARNRAMFGPPGHTYVYFIYGNHWCFNAVCQPEGTGEAVLVRAIEPAFGLPWMTERRPVKRAVELCKGPAKLCAALDIDRQMDGVDLCDSASPLLLVENPDIEAWLAARGPLVTTTRIGLSKAADWPLRFYPARSPWISRR